jgi:hypothetical protein
LFSRKWIDPVSNCIVNLITDFRAIENDTDFVPEVILDPVAMWAAQEEIFPAVHEFAIVPMGDEMFNVE